MEDDMIICHCMEVYKSEIVKAIKEKGLKTVEEVGDVTDAGTGCGGCQDDIQAILDEING
ncbi:MAG: (2Fe-2S)-binding protein [Bacteroidales bacterium]|jgi:NAD(P)H-nitrite reductase large subunit|nr:(2Fe-2S)-binding protein [Bacteroidales bacterium]MDY0314207.1 (2Fe-2S)-binding protein [Bacteroidales bacterium]NLB85772.1 (2Fe-2S)-binding protein [Bacteroidales bacterium]